MLRRLRRHSRWLAWAAGILAVPALLGGVNAAPADPGPAPVPEPEPVEMLPPDPVDMQAQLALTQLQRTTDVVPAQFRQLIVETAARHRLDPRLIAAVIEVETKWDPDAVGSYGELGLMQILPSTGVLLADMAGLEEYNLADPATNLHLGAGYLAGLLQEYGNIAKALAVYNGGPGAAETWQTNIYSRKVLKMYHRMPPEQKAGAPSNEGRPGFFLAMGHTTAKQAQGGHSHGNRPRSHAPARHRSDAPAPHQPQAARRLLR